MSKLWIVNCREENKHYEIPAMIAQWLIDEAFLPEQGTEAWLNMRKTLITASVASSFLDSKIDLYQEAMRQASIEKYQIKMSRNYHTRVQAMEMKKKNYIEPTGGWGQYMLDLGSKYEALIINMTSKINRSSCLLDIYIPLKMRIRQFLGASPDGCFTSPPRLLEVKTLIRRKMEKTVIPHKYWVQMQIQMYVYGALQCEYVEAKVEMIDCYGEWKYGSYKNKGCALVDALGGLHVCPIDKSYESWHDEMLWTVFQGEFGIMYYHIPESQQILVPINTKWIHDIALPQLYQAFMEIVDSNKDL